MMPNMQQAMKQIKKMQADMAKVQEELEKKTLTVTSGGGAIEVEISGKLEIKNVKIAKEAVDPDDVEMLQDLVMAACNEAIKQAQEVAEQDMAKVTGKVKIPGMPF